MRRWHRGLSEQDRNDWARLATGVRPLPGKMLPALPAAEARTRDDAAPARPAAPARNAPPPARPLVIGAVPAGLDARTWKRLGSGRLSVQRRLDLHGMTLARAFHAFEEVLAGAARDGVRCIEVITGQGASGQGALRRELAGWIDRPELRGLILAATHPHPRNPGSVLLLLRRRRPGG